MDETNNTMTSETVETELDSAWDDSDDGFGAADAGQAADQPNAQQEAAPAPENTQEQPAADQPKDGPADQPAQELFTVKNREETRQVTREELIVMAQKGLDYDAVRAERDQLRQYRDEANPALELVKGYAQRNNMTVSDYLDFCRKQELMRTGMDEQAADQTLQMEKRKADLDAQEARVNAQKVQQDTLLQQTKERQEARRKDMDAFLQAYPDVKADAIPKEVWAQVAQGVPLVSAYAMHENQRLKAELAAERQNKENKQRTTGSLGANSGPEMDELDRLWAEDD